MPCPDCDNPPEITTTVTPLSECGLARRYEVITQVDPTTGVLWYLKERGRGWSTNIWDAALFRGRSDHDFPTSVARAYHRQPVYARPVSMTLGNGRRELNT